MSKRVPGTCAKPKRKYVEIWEETNGIVPNGYVIHHKNKDQDDNRLENLECISARDHGRIHAGLRFIDGAWEKFCPYCKTWKRIDYFYERLNGRHECKSCDAQIQREYKRKHRDSILARRREWYKKNIEKIKEYDRKRWAEGRHANNKGYRGKGNRIPKGKHENAG